jgi:hypothetical protein
VCCELPVVDLILANLPKQTRMNCLLFYSRRSTAQSRTKEIIFPKSIYTEKNDSALFDFWKIYNVSTFPERSLTRNPREANLVRSAHKFPPLRHSFSRLRYKLTRGSSKLPALGWRASVECGGVCVNLDRFCFYEN